MILYRYLAKEVFATMFSVTGIVLVISMGWRFNGYLNDAADGTLSQDVLFLILAYRLPGFLELILPISFFLSIMLSYGRLHVDSEMVVLESCGMSPWKLIRITLVLASLVMAITGLVSLWLKPAGEAKAGAMFADQRNLTEFDTLRPGRFQSLRSGQRVTYAGELDDNGDLSQVFINEYKSGKTTGAQEVIAVEADSGNTVVDDNGNRFLVLRDGTRYTGQAGQYDYQQIEYEEYGQLIQKEQTEARHARRTAVPTKTLFDDPTVRNLSELQWRFSVMLMIPLLAVMAIPLSKVNPRQGRFTRLVPGMLLCFLYIVCLSAARSAVEKGQIPVSLGIWWVHLLFLAATVVLFNLDRFSALFKRKSQITRVDAEVSS